MAVKTVTLSVNTKEDMDIIDLTEKVSDAVFQSKIKSGIVTVFVPGSTASVTTTEFEPNLNADLEKIVEDLVPSGYNYKHHETWGDENGKSHIRASLFKPDLTVPFSDGKLTLGTWQNIVLIDFDVPARKRDVILQIMGE